MRIGDVATRTGVPPRMIRYYEAQGLLDPARGGNGYREYDEDDVDRVRRIRAHLGAGLPTRLIRLVFDMERPEWSRSCDRRLAAVLRDELDGLDERISCLRASRETIRSFLAGVGAQAGPEGDPAAEPPRA